ncbi:MAG: hypothetical protein J5382_10155 [Bacteroidales bacterium]|nr:hypothetical protein [Bacteroidales bacterium]
MIEELEYLKYISKVDPVEILMRAQEAQQYIDKGKVDDAVAYAIAAGIRLGIKAVLEQ